MPRFLALIGVIAVTAANALVLFFSSLLAAGGDGSAGGIYLVQIVGGLFILSFTGFALYMWHRGRPAVGIAASALPVAYATGLLCVVVSGLLSS